MTRCLEEWDFGINGGVANQAATERRKHLENLEQSQRLSFLESSEPDRAAALEHKHSSCGFETRKGKNTG